MMYAVEVITVVNRGMRSERSYATGHYDYFDSRAEAEPFAKERETSIIETEGPLMNDVLEEIDY